MAEKKMIKKLADVPLVKPGFEALGKSAPFIVQMNPDGKWESKRPANLDEDRLKAIVQHLVSSNAISAAQSYCCQCAAEDQLPKTTPQYVPVVMMPIYSADQCPFDMQCELQKIKDAEKAKPKATKKKQAETKEEKDDVIKKPKKRGYQMQRLTDFDLLSQW
ncbi:hypothetical protein PYW07_000573 [Mythimna separata]|uniref:Uncharacterized protein n=1 Tax=Mythimna separata TaxID=271217 RepID=A0AAD7Z348_MYTSE|nr:hypothetical protein PYW07_000573 [Mythimna separata]